MFKKLIFFISIFSIIFIQPIHANWFSRALDVVDSVADKTPILNKVTNRSLGSTKIGEGLKEALLVGITNAVDSASQNGGFLNNENIRIAMPDNLQMAEQVLRGIGFSQQMDQAVVNMNRAAEAAAPYARDIFLDALFEMNINDAKSLLQGGNTAATDYFRRVTEDQLRSEFAPIIDQYVGQYNLQNQFSSILKQYDRIPLVQKMSGYLNPTDYVTDQSIEGLFTLLAQEETKIRNNPEARVTDLLQQVFSK